MRSKVTTLLVILALVSSLNVLVRGQQATQSNVSASQLKEDIAKFEAVENNPDVPAEIKEINRGFLRDRREQLKKLLEGRADSLRQYLASLRATLTVSEINLVERAIGDLEQDLVKLSGTSPVSNALYVTRPNKTTPKDSAAMELENAVYLTQPRTNQVAVSDSLRRGEASEKPALNARTSSAPVSPQPPAAAPAVGQDIPSPQNCEEYKTTPDSFSLYERYICDMVTNVRQRKSANSQPIQLSADYQSLVLFLIAQKLRSEFLVDAEEARVDKQVGGASTNSGSTSLVVKGGTPAVLGFAVENGALERQIDGTTITFRGNPVGLVETLANKGFISGFEDDSPSTRFLRKTSFALSFDTSRGNDPGVFLANRQQLSSFSGRIEFINERDPRNSKYKNEWENFLTSQAQPFLDASAIIEDKLLDVTPTTRKWRDQSIQKWLEETQSALTSAAAADVEKVFRAQLAKLPIGDLTPDTIAQITNFANTFSAYLGGRQRVLDRVAKGTIATFEFTNKREVNSKDTLNFRGIYETSFGGEMDFTFNGSLTMYNKKPIGLDVNKVRDFQFAAQFDRPFKNDYGNFVFSVGGKYERLLGNAESLSGGLMPNTKGDIAVGQIKLIVPIKGLGMKFPISVTFANRTELVKESNVRGNFGFTFDIDSLLSRFKPY